MNIKLKTNAIWVINHKLQVRDFNGATNLCFAFKKSPNKVFQCCICNWTLNNLHLDLCTHIHIVQILNKYLSNKLLYYFVFMNQPFGPHEENYTLRKR